jgi:hypothetical protein
MLIVRVRVFQMKRACSPLSMSPPTKSRLYMVRDSLSNNTSMPTQNDATHSLAHASYCGEIKKWNVFYAWPLVGTFPGPNTLSQLFQF